MELLKRVIISIIAIPGLLFLYYYGKTPLLALFCLLSALSAYELYKMNHQKGNLIIFSVIPITVLTTLFVGMFSAEWSLLLMLASLILISFEDVFKNKLEGSFDRLSASAFIMLYCGAAFGFAYKIHSLPNGNFLLPALAVLIWITDSFAYFTGMSLGKHRGFFKASPKKSIEGFIGGFLFCIAFALLAHYLWPKQIYLIFALCLAFSAGLMGQYGDLLESIIKRHFSVKDSSNLIPGHGGILDRFDSFIVAAPVFYIIIKFLLGS